MHVEGRGSELADGRAAGGQVDEVCLAGGEQQPVSPGTRGCEGLDTSKRTADVYSASRWNRFMARAIMSSLSVLPAVSINSYASWKAGFMRANWPPRPLALEIVSTIGAVDA